MAMTAEARRPRMTVAAFLDWDDGTHPRYEVVDGEPVAMAPASSAHGQLVLACGSRLMAALQPPCRAVAEAGVRPDEHDDQFYVADVAVICTPHRAGERYLAEPVAIVEVLSPSTEAFDQGVKLPDYRRIASVREILLLSSTRMLAQVWQRSGDGWRVRDLTAPSDRVELPLVGFAATLGALYEGVALGPETPEADAAAGG